MRPGAGPLRRQSGGHLSSLRCHRLPGAVGAAGTGASRALRPLTMRGCNGNVARNEAVARWFLRCRRSCQRATPMRGRTAGYAHRVVNPTGPGGRGQVDRYGGTGLALRRRIDDLCVRRNTARPTRIAVRRKVGRCGHPALWRRCSRIAHGLTPRCYRQVKGLPYVRRSSPTEANADTANGAQRRSRYPKIFAFVLESEGSRLELRNKPGKSCAEIPPLRGPAVRSGRNDGRSPRDAVHARKPLPCALTARPTARSGSMPAARSRSSTRPCCPSSSRPGRCIRLRMPRRPSRSCGCAGRH